VKERNEKKHKRNLKEEVKKNDDEKE